MNKRLPIVAIVGQTNAGKSSLFNRLVGKKDAIVAREAGTTRDSVARTVDDRFILVDTAGLKDPEDDFEATIQDQIDDAIASADLILLVKDITTYPDQTDRDISKKVLRSKKPVVLVLNKADLKEKISPDEYLRLGIKIKDIFVVSAEHNQGIVKLRNHIEKSFDPDRTVRVARDEVAHKNILPEGQKFLETDRATGPEHPKDKRDFSTEAIKIALIGRPNVGKSYLFNTLGEKQQAIVAPVAGTTRDINRVSVKYRGQTIELLDTAGVRRPGKIEQGIEKFSVLRTVAAVEEADVCLLIMDVNELNTSIDQKLAGMIADAGRGLIIVVSKWDTVDEQSSDEILRQIASTFDFVPWAPVIFTSSVTGKNVTKIFDLATGIATERTKKIPTSQLNKLLQKSVLRHPPAGLKNTHPKFRYVVQTDVNPPWFVIYGSNFKFIHWSYKRYLERQFRDEFGWSGTPIKFSFRDEKQIKANRQRG
ncbi:MAG: ribosome biogenesis GTPase Der [Candidatus Nomurabacteria bacterium]|jgi:GTP-binding protein|nr:ribosome biogenesis GTPase Der [Candidatus Nomurabacteria bacterium]